MNKKKIVFVNQYYLPIKNPPAKRISAFAKYLSEQGWSVSVITGMPNYPNGKLLKKYKYELYCQEKEKKVVVHRFFEIPAKIKGFWKPFINYLSFSISVLFSFNILRKANLVYISNPPTFSSITAFYLAKLFGKKIVFEVRDLYPETAKDLGLIKAKSLTYKIFKKINKYIFRKTNTLISVTPHMSEEIKKKYFVKKIITLTNFADKKRFVNVKNKKIVVAYTGVITKAQDLNFFLEVNKNKEIRDKFDFLIVGDGNDFENIKKSVDINKYDNVKLYGYQSKEFCDKIISRADIGLLTLANNKTFESALPSKIFEYLSFGKPLLANQSTQVKEIIEKNKIGWFLDRNKTKMIKTLLNINFKDILKFSDNSKKVFIEEFETSIVCDKMKIICEETLKK